MHHGLVLRVVGDRVVFAPPLVIEAHEIDQIGQRLERALDVSRVISRTKV
jgi:adenosylmethionine-8-amino-7-oxononanoate aminotransferase